LSGPIIPFLIVDARLSGIPRYETVLLLLLGDFGGDVVNAAATMVFFVPSNLAIWPLALPERFRRRISCSMCPPRFGFGPRFVLLPGFRKRSIQQPKFSMVPLCFGGPAVGEDFVQVPKEEQHPDEKKDLGLPQLPGFL
jgi:hypothetical protein